MRYRLLAKPFKPKKIRILLIGEAPPPDGTTYFYRMPEKYSRPKSKIEDDTSLRATIFNHYFGRRPNDRNEYLEFLNCLKERGIFLIDILNKPIVIRKKDGSIDEDNLKILLSEENLNELDCRIKSLTNADTKIIFLLARTKYLKVLKNKFPNVSYIPWKCFRLDKSEANDCKNNNPNPISVKKYMTNHPATPNEVYDSICEAIQIQIDIIGNLEIPLSDEQIQEIVNRICRLNKQLDEYAKRQKLNSKK